MVDGPFSVGFTYGAYDIYCSINYVTYQTSCVNYAPVFAPLGNDSFFVSEVDSHNRLLAITPGQPGTAFSGPAPYSYNITPSGYPYPIGIQAYTVLSNFALDTATPCADQSFTGLYIDTAVLDASSYSAYGPLANPVTINVTGGFSLYAFQEVSPFAGGAVTTPYTVYDTSLYSVRVAAQYDGAAGSISISSPGNAAKINTLTTQMNLYSVDRLALVPTAAGINAIGLVDSGPAAHNCGILPIANSQTGYALALSNPVAIAGDDSFPGAAIIDNIGGTPYGDFVSLFRGDFGFGFYGFEPYMPAIQAAAPGSNPLDVAISPNSELIYVLNADGSISSISESNGAVARVVPAGTISGPNALSVLWATCCSGSGDSLFAASSNSGNIYEVDQAQSA
ncbi:MAG: hypothetical protein JO263_01620, partial [Candidatus Eremiobacteraeota bacterium]|nr:hypothetical protein [Candidatus Eremiobacteraeota bacterium]